MNFDLGSNVGVGISILGGATITATTTGETIDLAGFNSACAVLGVGAVATADGLNYFTFTIQVGDASDMSDAASATITRAITDAGATWDRLINAATEANNAYLIGFNTGGKRYCRIVMTATGMASACVTGVIVKGDPIRKPATI